MWEWNLLSRRWKKEHNRTNRTANSRKNLNARRLGKLQVLENIESGRDQKVEINERNEKTSQNQALYQKSLQGYKYLGINPRNIFETILIMDKGEIQTNGPEDKKIYDFAKGFTSEW